MKGWPLLLAAVVAGAEGLDTTLSLRGDAWTGTRRLDEVGEVLQGSAWGRVRLDTEGSGSVIGSGWLRAQNRADGDMPHRRLRELYWRYQQDGAELRIGRQMIAWGRADGINPTDNLSPRDFTLLTPEDGEQRFGNEALKLSADVGLGSLSGIWFPRAASHTLPLPTQANVIYTLQAPHRSQWAAKWEGSGDGADGSLSYFQGSDPMPDLVFNGVGRQGVEIALRNQPARIVGADLSLSRGSMVWRAEVADMRTDSQGADDFAHKKSQLWLVAGGEYSFDGAATLGLQATLLWVRNFRSPDSIAESVEQAVAWRQASTANQTAARQHGLTWRLAKRWWNDSLLAETSGVMVWPARGGIWRTRLDYAIDDHWHVQAGSDAYFGPARSYFGQLRMNRLLFTQLRYGW